MVLTVSHPLYIYWFGQLRVFCCLILLLSSYRSCYMPDSCLIMPYSLSNNESDVNCHTQLIVTLYNHAGTTGCNCLHTTVAHTSLFHWKGKVITLIALLVTVDVEASQIVKFMWPTWGPPGPHVGPMNLAIRAAFNVSSDKQSGQSPWWPFISVFSKPSVLWLAYNVQGWF